MRRTTIALLAALEAFVAVLVGLGAAVVPLVLVWAVHFDLAAPIDVFLRTGADAWLLGHGVDVTFDLDDSFAAGLGIAGADAPFAATIALLGFALVSGAFSFRIGRRAAAGKDAPIGVVLPMLIFAAAGVAVALLATHEGARVSFWQAGVLPAFVAGLGAVVGAGVELRRAEHAGGREAETSRVPGFLRGFVGGRTGELLVWLRAAARIGVGAATGVLGVAAALVTIRIALGYGTMAGLIQSLGAGIDGGIALTVGELALIPNLVVWAAAWLLGPGFELGTGNLVSPESTMLGPLPGVPLLGIVPTVPVAWPWGWLAVPVVFATVGGALVMRGELRRRRAAAGRPVDVAWWVPFAVGGGAGLIGGAVLGLLAWWSGGAVGPGRMAEFGPDPWPVAFVAAGSIGLAAIAGAVGAWRSTGDRIEHTMASFRSDGDAASGSSRDRGGIDRRQNRTGGV